MTHFLYILQSEVKETYYIGVINNLERRLHFHNNDYKGHTRRYRPWRLVYRQMFEGKEEALAAERLVKGWKSKRMIRLLVEQEIDLEDYL